jgi:hypothetical protein
VIRIHPRDEHSLLWYFNDAAGQLDTRGEMHASMVTRMQFAALRRPNHLNGIDERTGRNEADVIYIGSIQPSSRVPVHPDEDSHGMKAARGERRIRERLKAAGAEAEEILRLRFREVLHECRIPFGLEGQDLRQAKRGRKLSLIAVRLPLRRGPGTAAHLTAAARDAYAYAAARGAKRDLSAWVDQLGGRIDRGTASPAERLLGAQIAREAQALVLWAWGCYSARRPLPRSVPGARAAA